MEDRVRDSSILPAVIFIAVLAFVSFLPLLVLVLNIPSSVCPTLVCFLWPQYVVPANTYRQSAGQWAHVWSGMWIITWLVTTAAFGWLFRREPTLRVLLASLLLIVVITVAMHLALSALGLRFEPDGP